MVEIILLLVPQDFTIFRIEKIVQEYSKGALLSIQELVAIMVLGIFSEDRTLFLVSSGKFPTYFNLIFLN